MKVRYADARLHGDARGLRWRRSPRAGGVQKTPFWCDKELPGCGKPGGRAMSMYHKLGRVVTTLALFVVTPPITASASAIGITSIAQLGTNTDSFNWAQLGPAITFVLGSQTVA